MTGFHYDPPEMRALQAQIDRARSVLDDGTRYVHKYADLDLTNGEGLIMRVVGPQETAYKNMTAALGAFVKLTVHTRVALSDTMEHYWRVEQQNQQNADHVLRTEDAGIPNTSSKADLDSVEYEHRKPPIPGATWASFVDVAHPERLFTHAPEIIDGDHEWHPYESPTDVLSPSALVRWMVHEIAHVDIFAVVTQYLGGDWLGWRRAGTVWGTLGKAYGEIARNLRRAAADTPAAWGGNAADDFDEFLIKVAGIMDEMPKTCSGYAKAYDAAAQAAADATNSLNDLLGDIVDNAVYAAIAAGVGTLTAETIVGGLAGYGAAAFYIARIAELCFAVYEAMDKFSKLVDHATAAISTLELASENLPPMPRVPGD
ncbi:hypothetical protein [Actinomadura verrucosospora]|uniref:Uncharacterized protein n=1 Tax=Actinomadura verrucosospora TaxID=46165 RepID=A0A7D3W006_ACTVE|nr:hypothetical protein [Actinomadura verrucosospora]QKG23052.1 hypothetical protein ACTIVE_4693 [Actinomadura verrucosospora]